MRNVVQIRGNGEEIMEKNGKYREERRNLWCRRCGLLIRKNEIEIRVQKEEFK